MITSESTGGVSENAVVVDLESSKVAASGGKQKRRNYSKGADYERMKKAVHDWTKKCGDYYDDDGEPRSQKMFCHALGLPLKTFRKYIGQILVKGVPLITQKLDEVPLIIYAFHEK